VLEDCSAVGNSTVYRIYTSDDLGEVRAMARRLLAFSDKTCRCSTSVHVHGEIDSHRALDRYLAIETAWLSISVPAAMVHQIVPALEPYGDATRYRDGSAHLMVDLTPEVIGVLSRLPAITVEVQTHYLPLERDPAETLFALMGADPMAMAWEVCWPFEHTYAGFELGLNGAQLWHSDSPPGHSVFVHVGTDAVDDAHRVAAAVGGRVIGEGEGGW
jgi:hypothetical protein